MMTFVARVTPSLRAVGFAVEGDGEAVAAARKMVAALGGKSFVIAKNKKALYHAWGTLASPLLTALLAIGERVAESSGIPQGGGKRWMLPIVRQTIENYAAAWAGTRVQWTDYSWRRCGCERAFAGTEGGSGCARGLSCLGTISIAHPSGSEPETAAGGFGQIMKWADCRWDLCGSEFPEGDEAQQRRESERHRSCRAKRK